MRFLLENTIWWSLLYRCVYTHECVCLCMFQFRYDCLYLRACVPCDLSFFFSIICLCFGYHHLVLVRKPLVISILRKKYDIIIVNMSVIIFIINKNQPLHVFTFTDDDDAKAKCSWLMYSGSCVNSEHTETQWQRMIKMCEIAYLVKMSQAVNMIRKIHTYRHLSHSISWDFWNNLLSLLFVAILCCFFQICHVY